MTTLELQKALLEHYTRNYDYAKTIPNAHAMKAYLLDVSISYGICSAAFTLFGIRIDGEPWLKKECTLTSFLIDCLPITSDNTTEILSRVDSRIKALKSMVKESEGVVV